MAISATRPRPGQQPSYVVALVGADLGTTLTPAMHEREADLLGLRYVYRTVDIEEVDLPAGRVETMLSAARWLGLAGLNVTHPCKQVVLPLLDELSPHAAAIGAVNTVVIEDGRTVGHNTDWIGFAKSVQHGLPNADLGAVVVLGAGGAGSAVAYALLSLGAERVIINDLRADSAQELVTSLSRRFGSTRVGATTPEGLVAEIGRAAGIVNATPAGMAGRSDLPLPRELLRSDLWIADVVYRPLVTPFLVAAREQGCSTLDGGGMAVFQAAHAFRLFTGFEPDEQRMFAHFNELVELVLSADSPTDTGRRS